MSYTDELIAEFREGQIQAFERVWHDHLPHILRDASRVSTEYDELQDLLQEIQIALYTSRQTFAGTGEIGAWIHSVCWRRCVRWLRAQQRLRTCLTEFEQMVDPLVILDSDVETRAYEEEERDARVLLALDALTHRQREVVVRRALRHQSTAQVAAELGCAVGTIKATYHTALGVLRKHMQQERAGTLDRPQQPLIRSARSYSIPTSAGELSRTRD